MLKYYFICLSYLLFVTDIVQCKIGYYYNQDADGWLKLHQSPATWEEAFFTCDNEGAVLASPLNKQLADALHLVMVRYEVTTIFLGIHDLTSEGYFGSVEGVPINELDVRYYNNQGNNGHCFTTSVNGFEYFTNTSSCQDPLPYICYQKNECGSSDNEYRLNKQTGSCYKVHLEKETWPRAYGICTDEGGHLVILNDKEEARVVQNMLPPLEANEQVWDGFHIGLRAWGKSRTWMTIDGQRLQDVFHDWQAGEPNNSGNVEDRGVLFRNCYLNDTHDRFKARFVCEKPPVSFVRKFQTWASKSEIFEQSIF